MLLITATFAVYWPVQDYDFVNYDDNNYVYKNSHVQNGVTAKSIIWAFTTIHASNWHPLTWLSHMVDCQFFGLNAGLHHLTNLVFHIINTLLLLFIFQKMTGNFWQSSFVAGLFALHPMHVESVAWISERKNVLSTFFWMLTIWSYIGWVKYSKAFRYISSLAFFTLGLMAKPMLVTLPFVLILLDYWPLGRVKNALSNHTGNRYWRFLLKLIWEKVPFFIITAVSSGVTFYAQKHNGAVKSLTALPLVDRGANAIIAYIAYIVKMIFPFRLAVLYPYPKTLPWLEVAGASLILVFITLFAVKAIKKAPYFITGWLWYVGTLVPVIGLVQVGQQSMADRYAYIPFIGLFIIIAWGGHEMIKAWPKKKVWLTVILIALFSGLTLSTQKQIKYWRNSVTLFTHTLEVTTNNSLPHNNLGVALKNQGDIAAAIEHYQQALRIKPDLAEAHNNLGVALKDQGDIAAAIEHYQQALRIKPDYEKAHNNLAAAFFRKGDIDMAIKHRKKPYK